MKKTVQNPLETATPKLTDRAIIGLHKYLSVACMERGETWGEPREEAAILADMLRGNPSMTAIVAAMDKYVSDGGEQAFDELCNSLPEASAEMLAGHIEAEAVAIPG